MRWPRVRAADGLHLREQRDPTRRCDFRSGRVILQRLSARGDKETARHRKNRSLASVHFPQRQTVFRVLVRAADGKVGFEFAPRATKPRSPAKTATPKGPTKAESKPQTSVKRLTVALGHLEASERRKTSVPAQTSSRATSAFCSMNNRRARRRRHQLGEDFVGGDPVFDLNFSSRRDCGSIVVSQSAPGSSLRDPCSAGSPLRSTSPAATSWLAENRQPPLSLSSRSITAPARQAWQQLRDPLSCWWSPTTESHRRARWFGHFHVSPLDHELVALVFAVVAGAYVDAFPLAAMPA